MGNAKKGNAKELGHFATVDIDRVMKNYLRMQDALKAITEIPANEPPATAAMKMRTLAKAALG